jgi:hypothetical protein
MNQENQIKKGFRLRNPINPVRKLNKKRYINHKGNLCPRRTIFLFNATKLKMQHVPGVHHRPMSCVSHSALVPFYPSVKKMIIKHR